MIGKPIVVTYGEVTLRLDPRDGGMDLTFFVGPGITVAPHTTFTDEQFLTLIAIVRRMLGFEQANTVEIQRIMSWATGGKR